VPLTPKSVGWLITVLRHGSLIMDDDFRKKVVDDLGASGFASEMAAIQVFLKNDWFCTGNASYFDKDEQKAREIDLIAYRSQNRTKIASDSDRSISSFFYIVAEVKKAEKPWVVFRERIKYPLDAWNNLAHCDWPSGLSYKIAKDLSKDSLLANLGWRGYGIHESFKKPDQPSRWYAACISVSKASEHQLEKAEPLLNDQDEDNRPKELGKYITFNFVQPLIVLDGILLSAELNTSGEIEISEIDAAPMVFSYRSGKYSDVDPIYGTPTEKDYRIDIVRLSALSNYIERCKRRQATITDALQRTVLSFGLEKE
jgi:hypothetical protein